ncbi:MAG: regulatory protein RecX [Miltoncostaeaceae bacterium]
MTSVITALRASPSGTAIRVERDGAKWLRLPVHLVADLGLVSGEEMDDARVAEIQDAAALERLWEAALRYAVGRGRSRREVVRRLRDRRAEEEQVDAVLARLRAAGLADQQANAITRVERLAARGWASRRIQSEMLGAGFTRDEVRDAVDAALPEGHARRAGGGGGARGSPRRCGRTASHGRPADPPGPGIGGSARGHSP